MPVCPVTHHRLDLDGIDVFYRAAGPQDAPVVLLPHGYPCSSYEFRDLMPLLADRWRLLAPDFPGCGYSATPDDFTYDFDGYADFLERFTRHLGIERFALYLHDFGSQIGLRLAIAQPQRITALIVQNGDIYEDQLGPKYAALQRFFANPTRRRAPGWPTRSASKASRRSFSTKWSRNWPNASRRISGTCIGRSCRRAARKSRCR
ncbi:alpha/beta fold hydrolase [Stutzerimonas nitrititolerans]|uniref:alpha/beta fold hydrolase n=1 Tax=Stutzerimonas nitrititolerans TaxID=2482751 RepID=UPI002647746B|nr:alpha/beta hydrolase [Stutzerimonas nitrititolerans]